VLRFLLFRSWVFPDRERTEETPADRQPVPHDRDDLSRSTR